MDNEIYKSYVYPEVKQLKQKKGVNMKKIVLLLALLTVLSATQAFGQSVGINTDGSIPDASAILDIKSNSRGLLIPRMSSAQIAAIINPATGLMVYQTDGSAGIYFNSGTSGSPVWKKLVADSGGAPAGTINQFAGSSAPAGYMVCDGSAVSRSTYADLFAVIGTTYGAGDGSTTFNLPDLRSRIPVGRNASDGDFDSAGKTGGAKTHTITTAQLPNHNHSSGSLANASAGNHDHSISGSAQSTNTTTSPRSNAMPWIRDAGAHYDDGQYDELRFYNGANYHQPTDMDWLPLANASLSITAAGSHSHSISGSTGNTGSGNAIPIVQPYLVVNYIIKY